MPSFSDNISSATVLIVGQEHLFIGVIEFIADDMMTAVSQMNPNLIVSPRNRDCFNKCEIVPSFQQSEVCGCMLAMRVDPPLDADSTADRITNRCSNCPMFLLRDTVHDSEIAFFDFVIGK